MITNEQLIQKANQAMHFAYAPYSDFKVGAALLTKTDEIFTGCNVENAAFGVAICAERTAFVKAISEGYRDFLRIAIVSSSEEFTTPCGICRQFIMELAPDCEIVLSNKNNDMRVFKINELLPHSFSLI